MRRENQRNVREFEYRAKGHDVAFKAQLLTALNPCFPDRQVAWGLSFAWPRPALPNLELIPSTGMNSDAWDEHLMLQIVRLSNEGDFQRACMNVNAAGSRDCSLPVSDRALIDFMAAIQREVVGNA